MSANLDLHAISANRQDTVAIGATAKAFPGSRHTSFATLELHGLDIGVTLFVKDLDALRTLAHAILTAADDAEPRTPADPDTAAYQY